MKQLMSGNEAIARGVYEAGASYHVLSPARTGYSADQEVVSGTISRNMTVDVHYTRNTYDLTIRYIFADGTPAAEPVTVQVAYGDPYDIESPQLDSYTASSSRTRGTMGGRNLQMTVVYLPVQDGGPDADQNAPSALTIDDYAAPLGVGSTTVNAGESFE